MSEYFYILHLILLAMKLFLLYTDFTAKRAKLFLFFAIYYKLKHMNIFVFCVTKEKSEVLMKKIKFLAGSFFLFVLLASLFVVNVFAADGGYVLNKDKQETNIKWSIVDRVLTFEIDPTATGKVPSTELSTNPITGEVLKYGSKIPEFQNVIKCVIGEGITSVSRVTAQIPTLLEIELPKTVTKATALGEFSKALHTVYVKGNTPVQNHADLSYITSLGACMFNCANLIYSADLSENLTGKIPQEIFQYCHKIEELTIAEGVTGINAKAFANMNGLNLLTIKGMETTIHVDAFKGSKFYPAIKAYAGSAAEKFAKDNGYTFINIETGEEVEGTKPRPGETEKIEYSKFDTTGATAHGLMYDAGLTDNYWAYYADTKTLVIATRTMSGYNETGSVGDCTDGKGWRDYINEIEHVEIIGDRLDKITGWSFQNHTALKDVKIKGKPTQWDPGIFSGCTNLTTIWYEGGERVEGRADISSCGKINNIFQGTAIKEILLRDTIKNIEVGLPFSIRTILAPTITPELIQYCKDNNFDLVNSKKPDEKYSFYIEIDPTLPYCGDRAVYDFDEATGTLTIYGSGSIPDIQNFFGGGTKNQWWRSIRNEVKHIVIADGISSIGKYAFCELRNVESIRLPDRDNLQIWNCAFQSCENVKYITKGDKEVPIGTADLSGAPQVNSWAFANNFLIANVILNEDVNEIDSSVFDSCVNLQNIYSAPGSEGEVFAKSAGLAFFDASANEPQPIECTLPETTETAEIVDTDTEDPAESKPISSETKNDVADTTNEFSFEGYDDPDKDKDNDEKANNSNDGGQNTVTIVIIVAAVIVVVVIAAAAVMVISMKKKSSGK